MPPWTRPALRVSLLAAAVVSAFAVGACSPKGPPAFDASCKADSDCAKVSGVLTGDDACCFACETRTMNTAAAKQYEAWCQAKGTLEDCPEYECVHGPEGTPKCIDGTCKMVLPPA